MGFIFGFASGALLGALFMGLVISGDDGDD